mmetsp:Transcript_472/g.829  ORF Transcript_472/g.829 Transcript_472/m.829 type:complete len:100 (+) Transcript_472:130-429(+)
MEEMRRRQALEQISSLRDARALSARSSDPFGHLKQEFQRLMSDIYEQQDEPDMFKVNIWKNKLLYGNAVQHFETGGDIRGGRLSQSSMASSALSSVINR